MRGSNNHERCIFFTRLPLVIGFWIASKSYLAFLRNYLPIETSVAVGTETAQQVVMNTAKRSGKTRDILATYLTLGIKDSMLKITVG